MKTDLRDLLERQAAWQRSRSAETWAEKLRRAVIMRRDLLEIRKPSADSAGGGGRPRD